MAQQGMLVKGISTELQDAILSMLIFNNDMYEASKDIMSELFFYGDGYRTLYKALIKFRKTNHACPSLKDMMIQISLLNTTQSEIPKYRELLLALNELYFNEYSLKDDTVKATYFEEFVKRNGTEFCFSKVLEDIQNNKGVDWRAVNEKFKKYTDFAIIQTKPYNGADIEHFADVKREAVGDENCTKKIEFFLDSVNQSLSHKALIPGTLTMISAAPGIGKTLTLVNQGVKASNDGFVNLHVFLGDLNTYDGDCRYLANFSNKSQGEIFSMSTDEQIDLKRSLINDPNCGIENNWIVSFPSGLIDVDQLVVEIQKMQINYNVHFDQIIIDYDSNIKATTDNMYDSGGEIYDKLRAFAKINSSVMLVASQPKVAFFGQELLTLESASESSRKQHIVDLMITIGRPPKLRCSVGLMFIPKNRNGSPNKRIYIYLDGSTQTVTEITEDEYEQYKREALSKQFGE